MRKRMILTPAKMLAGALLGAIVTSSHAQELQLSPTQKDTIFTLIRQTGVAVKPPPSDIRVVIGAQVPAPTELYSLPHAAADKVPTARPYEYTIVNDTLVLVDPVSRKIVAIELQ